MLQNKEFEIKATKGCHNFFFNKSIKIKTKREPFRNNNFAISLHQQDREIHKCYAN